MSYTFITNYRGGTYIEQVDAPNILAATFLWAERTANNAEIEHLNGQVFRETFQSEIEEYPPVAIEGCPNVWYLSYFFGRSRMEVHVIKTVSEVEPVKKISRNEMMIA